MWKLMMTNPAKEWVEAGSFETVTAAARRIREIEGRATGGIFLSMLIETVGVGGFESPSPAPDFFREITILERPLGAVFCFPASAAEVGEAGGSSSRRNLAVSQLLLAWISTRTRRSAADRPNVQSTRTSHRAFAKDRARFPQIEASTGSASPDASPARTMSAHGSPLSPPVSETHRQDKPHGVRQSHEPMGRIEAGRRLVQCVDDHHRRAHRIRALEGTLQGVGEQH